MGFAGNLAGVMPDVLDGVDGDAALAEYGDMVGTPTTIMRDPDEVVALREQRQQQIAAQQTAETIATAGPGLKAGAEAGVAAASLLSETPDPRKMDPADILNRLGVGG
jgi:hypothetical protein